VRASPKAATGLKCGPPAPTYNDYLFAGEFRGDRSPLEVTLTEATSRNVVIDVGAKTVTAP
jgi:hypothetical protein